LAALNCSMQGCFVHRIIGHHMLQDAVSTEVSMV